MKYMEFLGLRATESAINTFTEVAFPCPSSKAELMAMLIHQIWFKIVWPDAQAALTAETFGMITKRHCTEILAPDWPAVICRHDNYIQGTAALAHTFGYVDEYKMFYFDPPILYPRDTIYISVGSVNNLVVKSATAKVGYTIEKVSQSDFIAALVD